MICLLAEKFYGVLGDSMCTGLKNSINLRSVTLGVIAGMCIVKLWTCFNRKFLNDTANNSGIISDSLFFTPRKLVCTSICNSLRNDPANSLMPCNSCSLKYLISVLRKTKNRLDVCMYLITSDEICNVILELFRSGVLVRIILDKHMSEDAYGADVVVLRKEYIPIKVIHSASLMHNKFVIIDEEAVLSGSLNWTKQGLFGNYENVIVSTNKNVIKKFTDYFQFLWDMKDD